MRRRSNSFRTGVRFSIATRFAAGWLLGVLLGYVFMEISTWYRTPLIGEVADEFGSLAAGSNYWLQDGPDAAVWRKRLGTPTMISTLEMANRVCWSYQPAYPWSGDQFDRLDFLETFLRFCFDKDTDRVNFNNSGEPFPSEREDR